MADEKFVTIELNKKQVDIEHPYHNGKNDKDYLKVFAPGGGVIFYPAESIKISKNDENKVYFTRPEGTELQINYSQRVEGVPKDAPPEEKYKTHQRTVKIEDLKGMYEEERRVFIEQQQARRADFVNLEVPTEWGDRFQGKDGKNYVSISIPVKEGEERHYYNFIVAADYFHPSTKDKDMSYFGFPKKQKDEDADFMVTLKRSVKREDGSYQDVKKEITSVELAEHVEAAKKNYAFINVEISKKLTREFAAGDGTPYVSVSVPVYNESLKKDQFYQIVVTPDRIREMDNDKTVRLSMFRKGGDGEDYVFHAKTSMLNKDTQQYEDIEKDLTSEEVAKCFKESKERYREQSERSLGDVIRENKDNRNQETAQQGTQEAPGSRSQIRRGGR